MQSIVREAHGIKANQLGRLKRFLLARDHKSQIADLLTALIDASDNFRVCF